MTKLYLLKAQTMWTHEDIFGNEDHWEDKVKNMDLVQKLVKDLEQGSSSKSSPEVKPLETKIEDCTLVPDHVLNVKTEPGTVLSGDEGILVDDSLDKACGASQGSSDGPTELFSSNISERGDTRHSKIAPHNQGSFEQHVVTTAEEALSDSLDGDDLSVPTDMNIQNQTKEMFKLLDKAKGEQTFKDETFDFEEAFMKIGPNSDVFQKDATSLKDNKFLNELKETVISDSVRLDPEGKIPEHMCNICNKVFARRYNLNKHMRTHSNERPFECTYCEKKYRQKSHLTNHMRAHTGDHWYKCQYCNFSSPLKATVITHTRTHTGEKPFACDFCPYKCADRSALRTHIRTHTGIKPYTCEECGKSFTQSTNFRSHQQVHSGLKPFSCTFCEKKFVQNYQLKEHLKTHNKVKSFECEECGKCFARKHGLVKHMETHSSERYACDKCGQTYKMLNNRNQHMKKCTSTVTTQKCTSTVTTPPVAYMLAPLYYILPPGTVTYPMPAPQ